MPIDVDGVKRLMRSNKVTYQGYLDETNRKINEAEEELKHLKKYKNNLSFYLDKSTKMLEVVEMGERSNKEFSEVHKNLYATDAYADKEE